MNNLSLVELVSRIEMKGRRSLCLVTSSGNDFEIGQIALKFELCFCDNNNSI
jgi:hypothetical protein